MLLYQIVTSVIHGKILKSKTKQLVMSIVIISMIQKSCVHFFQINGLVNYKIFHPKFLYSQRQLIQSFHIDVWFTDQNSKPLDIEDKMNITLVIN